MAQVVVMPKEGITVESCLMGAWWKNVGDPVAAGEVLFGYETDKAAFECVSTASGVLLYKFYEQGDEAPVLKPVAIVGAAGEDISLLIAGAGARAVYGIDPDEAADGLPRAEYQAELDKIVDTVSPAGVSSGFQPGTALYGRGRPEASPRARFLADEVGVDLHTAVPTGPGGRIVEADVIAAANMMYAGAPEDLEAAADRAQAARAGVVTAPGYGPEATQAMAAGAVEAAQAMAAGAAYGAQTATAGAPEAAAYGAQVATEGVAEAPVYGSEATQAMAAGASAGASEAAAYGAQAAPAGFAESVGPVAYEARAALAGVSEAPEGFGPGGSAEAVSETVEEAAQAVRAGVSEAPESLAREDAVPEGAPGAAQAARAGVSDTAADEAHESLVREDAIPDADQPQEPATSKRPQTPPLEGLAEGGEGAAFTDVRFTTIRTVIAKAMLASLQRSAQVTNTHSFDATSILAMRAEFKKSDEALGYAGVSVGDIILFVTSRALAEHPEINALVANEGIRKYSSVNLGVAVDTERGLMVPTIFNAEKKTIKEISSEVRELAAAARASRISPDLLTGGTFTVSNLGATGVESFTPIINPPQAAILGVCGITERVRKDKDGQIEVYPSIGLSFTYDHRAIDGAPASRFTAGLCEALAAFSWKTLMLDSERGTEDV